MDYNLNISKLVEHLTPPFLRAKVKLMAWMQVLNGQLGTARDQLYAITEEIKDFLSYDGRVFKLEDMLNAKYPDGGGDIYIDNEQTVTPQDFAFFESENQPGDDQFTYFYDETPIGDELDGYTYFKTEYVSEIDFIVFIPAALEPVDPDEALLFYAGMKALINRYKLAGKRYAIQTF